MVEWIHRPVACVLAAAGLGMGALERYEKSLVMLKRGVGQDRPSMWTRAEMAAADALTGVRSVAICVLGEDPDTRMCVGGSDEQGLLAEQLEFTIGSGPGFDAHCT